MATAPQERDVDSIVRYLTTTFERTCRDLERASATFENGKLIANEKYYLQREFAYLLHELTMGPKSVIQRSIAECNNLINQVLTKRNQAQ